MTSQVLANIYLNEYDRYVRHQLKPQAYVRYGDDFILIYPTRRDAYNNRTLATTFLKEQLKLTINPKNDIVVANSAGLKFLGHEITTNLIEVDKYTTKSVLSKLNWNNVASYRSLPLNPESRASLDWILLEEEVDEYD